MAGALRPGSFVLFLGIMPGLLMLRFAAILTQSSALSED
jgi:hypothetical protein